MRRPSRTWRSAYLLIQTGHGCKPGEFRTRSTLASGRCDGITAEGPSEIKVSAFSQAQDGPAEPIRARKSRCRYQPRFHSGAPSAAVARAEHLEAAGRLPRARPALSARGGP